MQPILQSSCARATCRAETRFRIDAPIEGRHGARVIALDDGAATLVRRLARESWNGARFYTLVAGDPGAPGGPTMPLHRTNGVPARLDDELAQGDVAVMVATTGDSGVAASTIGRACARRGIMTAAVVLGEHSQVAETVTALRPHAQVLLISRDAHDVGEVLSAIRA